MKTKLQPIILTEKLLLKSNMIADNYGVFYLGNIWIKKCEVDGIIVFDVNVGECFGKTQHFVYIKYLHELQNIFALTQIKLEINL